MYNYQGLTLHFSFIIDYHTGIICNRDYQPTLLHDNSRQTLPTFEVNEGPVFSTIRLSLSHHHSEMHCKGTHPPRTMLIEIRLGLPFFLRSGFPFFTVARTRSPAPAAGRRLSRPLIPFTAMMYRFLAPVLSAQFMTAPTGSPSDILNFAPDAPFFPADTQTL